MRKEQELLQRQQEEEVRREAELEARQRAVENHMQPIPSPVKIKKDNSRLFGSPEKVAVNDTVGRSSRPSSAIRRHSKVPVVNSRPTSSEDVSDRRDSPTTSPKKSIRPQDNRNYLFEQEELPQKPMAESVKLIKTPRRVSEDKEVRQLAEKSAKSQLFDPLSPREVSARRESASRSTINSSNRPRSRQQEIVDTKALTENVLRKNSANRTMHQLEEDVNVDKQSHGYQQETFQMQRPNYFEGLDLLQGKSNVQRPPIPTNNPPVNPPKLPLQQRIPDFGSSIGLDKTLDFESKFVLPDGSVFQPDKSKLDKSRPISAASSIPVDVDSLPNRETSALITDFKDTLQLLEDNDDPSVNRFTGKSSAVNDGSRSPDEDINVERLLRKNNRKLNMLDKINNNVNPSDVHSLLHRLSDIHSRPTTAGTEKRPSSSSTSRDEDRLYRNNSNKNIMNNNNNDNKKDNGYSSRPTSGSSSRISPRIRAPDSAVTGLQRSSSLQRSGESLIAERNKLKAISKATNSNPLNIAATKNINSSRVDRSILERNEMSSAKSKQQYHSTRYAKDYSYDSDGSDAYSDYGL